MPFETEGWGAEEQPIALASHPVGQRQTQQLERQPLTGRTWIKRCTRQTLCLFQSSWLPGRCHGVMHQPL